MFYNPQTNGKISHEHLKENKFYFVCHFTLFIKKSHIHVCRYNFEKKGISINFVLYEERKTKKVEKFGYNITFLYIGKSNLLVPTSKAFLDAKKHRNI